MGWLLLLEIRGVREVGADRCVLGGYGVVLRVEPYLDVYLIHNVLEGCLFRSLRSTYPV